MRFARCAVQAQHSEFAWIRSFFNYTISLPDRDKQSTCLDEILRMKRSMDEVYREQDKQEKWLAELRSALLHEAISGQLTADWRAANRDAEPAHVFLERIAEEKAELIRTKQIRKEKPAAHYPR